MTSTGEQAGAYYPFQRLLFPSNVIFMTAEKTGEAILAAESPTLLNQTYTEFVEKIVTNAGIPDVVVDVGQSSDDPTVYAYHYAAPGTSEFRRIRLVPPPEGGAILPPRIVPEAAPPVIIPSIGIPSLGDVTSEVSQLIGREGKTFLRGALAVCELLGKLPPEVFAALPPPVIAALTAIRVVCRLRGVLPKSPRKRRRRA